MYFQFKQFGVFHGASAMKVGTDGVTLGAWAPCSGSVLDVGCGCGLIGLMAAQRGASEVVMIEIDPAATAEAATNAAASPWADKVKTLCADFLEFTPTKKFDSIISNPPFFATGLLAPDNRRAAARHEGHLTPEAFMRHAATLLAPNGTVSIIIPHDRLDPWLFAARLANLCPQHLVRLITKRVAPPRRYLITFTPAAAGLQPAATLPRVCNPEVPQELIINSPQYQDLVKDFYL